jgi:hypothetical protein
VHPATPHILCSAGRRNLGVVRTDPPDDRASVPVPPCLSVLSVSTRMPERVVVAKARDRPAIKIAPQVRDVPIVPAESSRLTSLAP